MNLEPYIQGARSRTHTRKFTTLNRMPTDMSVDAAEDIHRHGTQFSRVLRQKRHPPNSRFVDNSYSSLNRVRFFSLCCREPSCRGWATNFCVTCAVAQRLRFTLWNLCWCYLCLCHSWFNCKLEMIFLSRFRMKMVMTVAGGVPPRWCDLLAFVPLCSLSLTLDAGSLQLRAGYHTVNGRKQKGKKTVFNIYKRHVFG